MTITLAPSLIHGLLPWRLAEAEPQGIAEESARLMDRIVVLAARLETDPESIERDAQQVTEEARNQTRRTLTFGPGRRFAVIDGGAYSVAQIWDLYPYDGPQELELSVRLSTLELLGERMPVLARIVRDLRTDLTVAGWIDPVAPSIVSHRTRRMRA